VSVQICLAGGMTLSLLPRLTSDLYQAVFGKAKTSAVRRDSLRRRTGLAVLFSILASSVLSASRIYGILLNYSAPMHTWAQLPLAYNELRAREQRAELTHRKEVTGPPLACVGAEWHRYSSSFFLPRGVSLAFVEAGFDGVLQLTAELLYQYC
jgi:hypothetical protein